MSRLSQKCRMQVYSCSIAIGTLFFALLPGCGPQASKPGETASPPQDTVSADGQTPDNPTDNGSELTIVTGERIGPVILGATFAEVRNALGEPNSPTGFQRLIIASWPAHGLEVVFASELEFEVNDASWVMAMSTKTQNGFSGLVTPGMVRSQIESVMGEAQDEAQEHAFYQDGLSVQYDASGLAMRIGVFPAYTVRSLPPAMLPATTSQEDAP